MKLNKKKNDIPVAAGEKGEETKEMETIECGECKGEKIITCSNCKGEGVCPECKGDGYLDGCEDCGGESSRDCECCGSKIGYMYFL